jgi:hypothetical protein
MPATNAFTDLAITLHRRYDDDSEDMMISLSERASQMTANALTLKMLSHKVDCTLFVNACGAYHAFPLDWVPRRVVLIEISITQDASDSRVDTSIVLGGGGAQIAHC